MTLEMRYREKREEGKIYGIISACRECNISEERILKILQEKEGLSEESAIVYLEEAEEAIKRMNEYTAFMDKLGKIISDLKKINAGDDAIIVKIQDEFHFTNDDAKFYYEYAMKKKDFTGKSGETVQSAKKDGEWSHEYMTLQMNYQEKYEQGIEQGVEQEKIDSAVRMIEDGDLPLEKIAMYSGLTLEQVLKLEKELQLA
ncbi:hypothetical protein C805_00309 [Eubacterium sp. 14-2]|nr:hypothetical protein C805_00309 [Eubacterium sp. 14-2]